MRTPAASGPLPATRWRNSGGCFNAIGNPDIADLSFERLSRFGAAHPMLNPPDRVLRTRRDLMPALLEGIPGLVVPRVLRLRRDQVLEGALPERLAAHGMACPVIVRPIGTQGGHGGYVYLDNLACN